YLIERMDGEPFNGLADFGRVDVTQGSHAESLLLETAIAEQGTGQIPDADEDRFPFPVDAKSMANGGRQFRGRITDARLAQVPEVGQVFADLSVAHSHTLTKLAAGNFGKAVALQRFQAPQIQTEPPGTGSGQPRIGRTVFARSIRCVIDALRQHVRSHSSWNPCPESGRLFPLASVSGTGNSVKVRCEGWRRISRQRPPF